MSSSLIHIFLAPFSALKLTAYMAYTMSGHGKKKIKQQRSHVFYSFEYLISPISSNMKGANQAQSLVNMLKPGLMAYS